MITYQSSQTEAASLSVGEIFMLVSEKKPESGRWEPYIRLPEGVELMEQEYSKKDPEKVHFRLHVQTELDAAPIHTGFVDAENNTEGTAILLLTAR